MGNARERPWSAPEGRRAAALAAAWVALAAPLAAQPQARTPVVFLEKAYFSIGTPTRKNLLFEGQPTVHYFIRNRLADETWQRDGGIQWTLPVSAVFLVRMSDTTSEPVRTPSYRIRPLYTQVLWLWRPENRLEYRLLGASGGFTHYSNGQAGCTYQGFARDASDECIVTDAALAARRLTNTRDGDFSTSYLSAALHWRQGWLEKSDHPMRWQYSAQAEGQLHPYHIRPGGMNRAQARTYGQNQWSASAEAERRHGVVGWLHWLAGPTAVSRVAGTYERRFGGPADVRLSRQQLELSVVGDSIESLGLFARLHRGFDYYNIQYQDTRPFFAVGVMWDVGRLDKLNTRSPE